MSAFLAWSITTAQILLALAMACATFRILWGPRAQDRVVGFDSLYVNAMLLLAHIRHSVWHRAIFRGGADHCPARIREHRSARQVPASWRGDRMNGIAEIHPFVGILTACFWSVAQRSL